MNITSVLEEPHEKCSPCEVALGLQAASSFPQLVRRLTEISIITTGAAPREDQIASI